MMKNTSSSTSEMLKKLNDEKPKFHGPSQESIGSENYAIRQPVLEWMANHIPKGGKTLETGCGYTTVILSMLSKNHTTISPFSKEHVLIRQWCHDHDISTEHVQFIAKISQDVLPTLNCKGLDFVLIDGDHAFPGPFIDWYYTADKIKVGGYVAVDDTQIPTGKILRDFLFKETKRWVLEIEIGKTAIFKRVGKSSVAQNVHWMEQPFCEIPNENSEQVKKILSKLKQDYNITSFPIKEIIAGKKPFRKIRTMLQREVHDWTLVPYLKAQSSFNLSLIELLELVISDLQKQDDETI